jgi:hypothetical protein
MQALWDEGSGRILLGDNTRGVAAMLRPIWSQCVGSLDLNWTAWYIQIRPTIFTNNSDLRKIKFASNLPDVTAVQERECVYCTHLGLTNVTTGRLITAGGTSPKWYTVAYNYWGKLIDSETVNYRLCNNVRLTARWKWDVREQRWSVWCMFQSLISSCKYQLPEAHQQWERASEDRVTAVSVLQLVFHHMTVTTNCYWAQCSITCR